MAYEIGSATDFADLRSKLITFLTTHPDLVSSGQNWSVAWEGSGRAAEFGAEDIVLAGPGTAGLDQVFVGMRSVPNANNDTYNYWFRGVVGINPNASTYIEHTNVSESVAMLCGNFEMPYWFVANGRRFVVVVKISTTYQMVYGGLFLAYAPPNLYSYPLAVGGTYGGTASPRWSATGTDYSFFPDPGTSSSLKVFNFDNIWVNFQNWSSGSSRDATSYTVAPWNPGVDAHGLDGSGVSYRASFFAKQQPAFGGRYVLTPATLCRRAVSPAILGSLQGVFHVPGFNLSAETILNYDGVQYLCVPNVYREGNEYYCAIALDGD